MALINYFFATFVVSVLALLSLLLILFYILFYNEEDLDSDVEAET